MQPDRGAQQRRLAGAVVAHHGGTTPPGGTSRSTPCTTVGSPVAEHGCPSCSNVAVSSRQRPLAQSRGPAEIDLLHLGVGLHLGDRALR